MTPRQSRSRVSRAPERRGKTTPKPIEQRKPILENKIIFRMDRGNQTGFVKIGERDVAEIHAWPVHLKLSPVEFRAMGFSRVPASARVLELSLRTINLFEVRKIIAHVTTDAFKSYQLRRGRIGIIGFTKNRLIAKMVGRAGGFTTLIGVEPGEEAYTDMLFQIRLEKGKRAPKYRNTPVFKVVISFKSQFRSHVVAKLLKVYNKAPARLAREIDRLKRNQP